MVQVIPLDKIGEDERGTTHVFETERTGQFIVAHRKAGSLSGRHYHKGLSPNKHPEKILVMKGEATMNWHHVRGDEKGSVKIIAPSLVFIEPWAWHELIADTDIVVLELNALADGQGDSFRLD